VSDPVTTARTARESLARGLNALQSDPNIPSQLLDLAAPIAQAMGALHAIERSNGTQLVPHAEVALNHTRTALSQLQSQPSSFAAVTQAMEAVAASLASVHSLTRMSGPPAVAPVGAAFAATAPQPVQAAQQPAPQQPAYQAPPQPAYAPPQQAFPPPQQAYAPPQAPVARQSSPSYSAAQGGPRAQPAPQAAPPGYARDPFAPAPAPAPAGGGSGSMHPPNPPAQSSAQVISADLGTQSPTNFYKGLSGNDIIEHGGIFVSTYMIPKIGTNVRLKISLPGGYEFEANALVKWSREQSDDSAAPPGFGAQFTQITPEARQLVYRYTRNREPLFHDDM
jgi:Tfp pilus assembly protein PilZ